VEYRGIRLHESVKLFKNDGSYNKQTKRHLDALIERAKMLNYEILGEWKKSSIPIKLKCDKEHIVDMIPNNFIRDRQCFECADNNPDKAKKQFYEKVKEVGYTLLGEYVKAIEKVDAVCDKGHHIKLIPSTFISCDSRCVECVKIEQSKRQSEEERKNFPLLVKSNGHTLLTPYGQNCEDKVLINYHCGHEPYWIRPIVYKKRTSVCPICQIDNRAKQMTKKSERNFLLLLKSNGHEILSPFINVTEKVLIDFKCGHDAHMITPHKYKQGGRCPKCIESNGVKTICEWLEANSIGYEIEYRLPNKRWRYDIHIPSHKLLIEVHGLQHYEEVAFFHKDKTLEQEQANDRKKRRYAERLGYNYLDVDYREHNPDLALNRFLNQFEHEQLILF
jgi:hypothetical protein